MPGRGWGGRWPRDPGVL